MALIKCPECGREVSDKASKCPQCGFPIRESMGANGKEQEESPTEDFSVQQHDEPNKKKKPLIVIGVLVVILIGIVIVGALILSKRNENVTVNDVDISKWKLTDRGEYSDSYEGTVVSETEDPFVAVIGYYEDDSEDQSLPKFVYMEEGKGILQVREYDDDDDPSIKYRSIGYMTGNVISEDEFKDISVSDSDYHDYSWEETSCDLSVEFEMNSEKNGILFFEMTNETTNEISYNCYTIVSDGKSEFTEYLTDLPYKIRGLDMVITPKYFCEADELKETDYDIEKDFDVEKGDSTYYDSYSGKEELVLKGHNDGMVLYTTELIDGGKKEDRNIINYTYTYLKKESCDVETYYSASTDDKILEPKYEINIFGYIEWKDFAKEC